MSNMSDLSIQLVLIRAEDTGDTDDMVVIKKNLATNEYVINYTDPNEGSKVVHEMSGLYRQKVLDYVYYLLKNQYLDEEGFEKLQVNLPAMPRMIVSGSQMRDVYYRNHFYELIGFALDTLETTTNLNKKPPSVMSQRADAAWFHRNSVNYANRHLFSDEC